MRGGTVFVGVTESIARACYVTCSAKVVGLSKNFFGNFPIMS